MDDTPYKFRCKTRVCPKTQEGAALLLLLLITVVTASSIFVTTLHQTTTQIALDKHRKTRYALAKAKEALIAYALTYSEQQSPGQPQGFLPCPDLNGDGTATIAAGETPCGGSGLSVLGWLPWRQLGLPPLRDGDGECLWYAVSGNYKNNVKASLTSDTDGQFILQDGSGNILVGTTAENQAIAIVFAPGGALGVQDRSGSIPNECGSANLGDAVNQPANYLDTFGGINNATGNPSLPTATPSVFVSPPATGQMIPNFNDTLLAITPQDFLRVYARMDRWVANRVQQCVAAYSAPRPWAAALDLPLISDPPDFGDDANQRFGRVPDDLTNSGGGTWPDDPAIPLSAPLAGPQRKCFNDLWSGVITPNWSWWWWDTWREIVFYAVDTNYAPGGLGGTPAALQFIDTITPTPPGPPPPPSQFVVAVAGRKLSGQQRNVSADKANITNYLEDHNDPNLAAATPPGSAGNIPTGDEQFVTTPTVAGAAFNDTPCNDAGCP